MRVPAGITASLLPLVLSGCFVHNPFHRNNQANNPPVAPPLPPGEPIKTVPVELPPSATTIPQKPTESAQTPSHKAPKPPSRRKPPQQAKDTQEVAANAPPPGVSALGQISSGDPAEYRRQTEESILAIEKGLNGLNRPLDDTEQKTADHIREFLKQARAALATGDVDGAHNLAAKAKVLLAELTK